ncbi:MAG: rhodanese-like domain-containing protein [Acidobacteriota bacterium]
MAILVVAAAIAGAVANTTGAARNNLPWLNNLAVKAPLAPATDDAATTAGKEPPGDVEIDTATAHAEWANGATFIDARPSSVYTDEGHIARATSIGVWEGDADVKVATLTGELAPDTRIVVYCTGGDCHDSRLLREKLLLVGFKDVLVYRDGFPGWTAAGHPVEK